MKRLLIAALFALSFSSAFAVPPDNGIPSSSAAKRPASKPSPGRGPGDYPRTKPYAAMDQVAGGISEDELVCLMNGACKLQARS
jgi:hypothetical protein